MGNILGGGFGIGNCDIPESMEDVFRHLTGKAKMEIFSQSRENRLAVELFFNRKEVVTLILKPLLWPSHFTKVNGLMRG